MRFRTEFWRTIAGLVLFAVAFGYVEAAVVAYLRSIYVPLRAHFYPALSTTELFPLLSLDQLRTLGPEHTARLNIELGREFATLLMLSGVALAVARKLREWVGAFVLCFGFWDIAFYSFLKLLLNWPASLLTWDILFLLPVPWVGPVVAPILVSISMIVAGFLWLWREYGDNPFHMTRARWAFILLGGLTVFVAFIYDFPNTAGGGTPNAFRWDVFFVGEAIALLAFATPTRRRKIGSSQLA
jgi:hypothetical protein